jgi:hypothetical protein
VPGKQIIYHTPSKEIFFMKRIAAVALFVCAVLVTASGAPAQGHVLMTVPFDFTVGNKLLPSGIYEIPPPLGNAIKLTNTTDTHITALVYTIHEEEVPSHDGVAVFTKYGNQYFMRKLLCTPAAMNVSLFPSKQERQIRQQVAEPPHGGDILIAAK